MKKFMKRCRECTGMYDIRDKPVTIKLNHKDIETIEDIFFCENSEEQYRKMKPRLLKVWVQLCHQEDKWPENKKRNRK